MGFFSKIAVDALKALCYEATTLQQLINVPNKQGGKSLHSVKSTQENTFYYFTHMQPTDQIHLGEVIYYITCFFGLD